MGRASMPGAVRLTLVDSTVDRSELPYPAGNVTAVGEVPCISQGVASNGVELLGFVRRKPGSGSDSL
jgi:hypothetical protein